MSARFTRDLPSGLRTPDDEGARACRVANHAWAALSLRGPYKSQLARLKALSRAGALHDETYFERLHARGRRP